MYLQYEAGDVYRITQRAMHAMTHANDAMNARERQCVFTLQLVKYTKNSWK